MNPEGQYDRPDLSIASATEPLGTRRYEVDSRLPGLTVGRALRAEWLKLISLRSTWWLSGTAVVLCALFTLLTVQNLSWTASARDRALNEGDLDFASRLELEVIQAPMFGIIVAIILLGAMSVVTITGEHSTGALRSSLSAVPRRGALWSTKALALACWTGMVGVVICVVSYLLVLPFAATYELTPSLLDPDVLHVYAASVAAVVLVSLLGYGLGSVLRNSAGGIVVFALLVFALPLLIVMVLGAMLGDFALDEVWSAQVLQLIFSFTDPDADRPSPALAGLGLCLWAAAALLPGWFVFRYGDA